MSVRRASGSAARSAFLCLCLCFDGLDCLPCNLTLNFIGEAVRLSKLSSLGMGFLPVSHLFHNWVELVRHGCKLCVSCVPLLSPSLWLLIFGETVKIGKRGLFGFSEFHVSVWCC